VFLLVGALESFAASVTLQWDANTESDLSGYRVYYGTSSSVYSQSIDVGNVTQATVPDLVGGTTYYFAVTAYNVSGLESAPSNEVSYVTGATNQSPVVSLTSPAAGGSYTAPATVTMNASASDADGSVAKVEFFSGTVKLGEATTAPFTFTWSNVPSGSYDLAAVATDNAGATARSTAATINVKPPNQLPTVAFTAPAQGSVFTAPGAVTLTANASDPDGNIAKVEFFAGATKLGEATTAPFSIAWQGVAAGTYAVTATATDYAGGSSTTQPLTIVVNGAPAVSLTSNGTSFVAPASVVLSAMASDQDGSIARVEFYQSAKARRIRHCAIWMDVEFGAGWNLYLASRCRGQLWRDRGFERCDRHRPSRKPGADCLNHESRSPSDLQCARDDRD